MIRAALILNSRDYPVNHTTALQITNMEGHLGNGLQYILHEGRDKVSNHFSWAARSTLQSRFPFACGFDYDTCANPECCRVQRKITHGYNFVSVMLDLVRASSPHVFIFRREGDPYMGMAERMVEASGLPHTIYSVPKPEPVTDVLKEAYRAEIERQLYGPPKYTITYNTNPVPF